MKSEELFIDIILVLQQNNIEHYPHFGKYISKDMYFNKFFNKTIMDKYNIFRDNIDPYNQFSILLPNKYSKFLLWFSNIKSLY